MERLLTGTRVAGGGQTVLGTMSGPLGEQTGGVTACDSLCQCGAVFAPPLL